MAVDTSKAIKRSFKMTPEDSQKMVKSLNKLKYTRKTVKSSTNKRK